MHREYSSAQAHLEDKHVPFDLESDDDFAQRALQRLENRCWRAQIALVGGLGAYGSLREAHGEGEFELHQALQRLEQARQHLADLQCAIELAEVRAIMA
jgi:hypothetical protein